MLRSHFGHHPVATNKTHSVKHCLYISMCDWIDFNQLCDCPETLNISKIFFDFEETATKKKVYKKTTTDNWATHWHSSQIESKLVVLSDPDSFPYCFLSALYYPNTAKMKKNYNYTLLFFSHTGYRNVLVFDSTENTDLDNHQMRSMCPILITPQPFSKT